VNFFKDSHSKIALGKGESDTFYSGLSRSAKELHLRFLDPPLDQLVEGSDVGKLLDSPPSLALLSSSSEMRRISFIVGTVFKQKRSQSGPPQVHDGPIDSGLSNSRFILCLYLHLGSLQGGDLPLEFVIELLQCLLLAVTF